MSKKIHLNIGGMSCIHCQNKIEAGLRSKEGVQSASVNYRDGSADITYEEGLVSRADLVKTIEALDYEVLREDAGESFDLEGSVSILVIIIALYYMLQSLGILNRLIPTSLADAGMGYGMLFVIGLITSVHCIAMCGGIGLSQSLPKKEAFSGNTGKLQTFIPSLAYNLGRVCSYTAIGFVLGLIGMILGGGSDVGISSLLQGILKIIAGLFMVVMGINMLGIFPWLRKFTIRTPRVIAKVIGKKRRAGGTPFAIGLLNGFMPCGPLQSMWIVALATGNPFAGALSMFLFSLGTVPLMLGFGSVVSLLGRKFTDQVMRIGAVLVVVLGLSMLSQGGALSGLLPSDLLLYLIIALCIAGVLLSLPNRRRWMRYAAYAASFLLVIGAYVLWNTQGITASENREGDAGEAQVADGIQVIESTLTLGSYPDITVQAGIPVRWTIEAPEGSLNGCNYRMLIPAYGIEHTFDFGENVIEFTPDQTGVVNYSCWMGMIRGTIHVTDQVDTITIENMENAAAPISSGYNVLTNYAEESCCGVPADYTEESCCGVPADYAEESCCGAPTDASFAYEDYSNQGSDPEILYPDEFYGDFGESCCD
ncbi:MAG: sulfite exporter TauE/SafE family protein [Lachnospiraceae bacterium]|nr:sulfite exporter TauE/SafE family protein [Lachnospiraceae bacterium]